MTGFVIILLEQKTPETYNKKNIDCLLGTSWVPLNVKYLLKMTSQTQRCHLIQYIQKDTASKKGLLSDQQLLIGMF